MKILVRAPNWLGDAVMSTPFLKRLAAKHPGALIDVLAKPSVAGVFNGMPGLRRVIRMNTPEAAPAALKIESYETSYILPTSFSSAWKMFRAGIPRRIGYAAEFRSFALTEALPLEERYHYVRRYLGLIGEEGRDVTPEDFYFPTEDPPFVLPEGPVFAIAPGSRAPARRWFPERFAAVVDGLPAGTVLLLGAPEDAPWAARTADAGTPMVIVAGPSEPRCTSPFGARVRILQHREIPCVPCVKNECFRPAEDKVACLKAVPPSEVLSAVQNLLV
jgi:heptosyltransferase-2